MYRFFVVVEKALLRFGPSNTQLWSVLGPRQNSNTNKKKKTHLLPLFRPEEGGEMTSIWNLNRYFATLNTMCFILFFLLSISGYGWDINA